MLKYKLSISESCHRVNRKIEINAADIKSSNRKSKSSKTLKLSRVFVPICHLNWKLKIENRKSSWRRLIRLKTTPFQRHRLKKMEVEKCKMDNLRWRWSDRISLVRYRCLIRIDESKMTWISVDSQLGQSMKVWVNQVWGLAGKVWEYIGWTYVQFIQLLVWALNSCCLIVNLSYLNSSCMNQAPLYK